MSASPRKRPSPIKMRSVAMYRYFDHLVGGHLHDQRRREAERLGGLEIDDQLEFGRLDYWKIGRLLTLRIRPT